MTREEAARVLEEIWIRYTSAVDDIEEEVDAMFAAIDALLGPVPDPTTGLVPCGCGGKARLLRKPIGNWVDHKIACDSCTMETAWVAGKDSADMAKIEWNTAMGWKGGAE